MSVEAMAVVLHHSRATGSDKVVLLGIANHDGDGGAWPSLETLAKYANMQVRGVQKCLRRLEALGEIVTAPQAGGTRVTDPYRRPNLYRITLACPPECDGTTAHRTSRGDASDLPTPTPPVRTDTPPPVRTDTPPLSARTPEPSLNRPMNHPPSADAPDDGFAAFWSAYPKKVGKRQAQAAYAKALDRATASAILNGAVAYAAEVRATGVATRFIKHPQGWLNDDRWENYGEALPQRLRDNGWTLLDNGDVRNGLGTRWVKDASGGWYLPATGDRLDRNGQPL